MSLTRIEALNIAIDAIGKLDATYNNTEAIRLINNMKKKDSYIKWTKEEVFNKLNEWQKEHNRNPTTTNLSEPNMPKGVTIQKLFDMKPSAFLNIYYPNKIIKANTSRYTLKTKEEWVNDFILQCNKIHPKSSRDYNTRRDDNTPTWNTIARYLKINTWNELIIKTNLSNLKQDINFNTESYIPLLNQLYDLEKQKSD